MTPFAGINRITSPYGYREYWYNGRLIKEQHKGQDIVPTQQAGQALPESAWAVREVTGGTVTAVSTGYTSFISKYLPLESSMHAHPPEPSSVRRKAQPFRVCFRSYTFPLTSVAMASLALKSSAFGYGRNLKPSTSTVAL